MKLAGRLCSLEFRSLACVHVVRRLLLRHTDSVRIFMVTALCRDHTAAITTLIPTLAGQETSECHF